MKWLKVLLCAVLIVAVFTVPCFATNEGTYGHYISPGTYTLANPLRGPGTYSEAVVTYQLLFRFDNSDVVYNQMSFTSRSDAAFDLNYKNTDTGANVRANRDQVWTAESYRHIEVLDGFYIYDPVLFLWWTQNVIRTDGVPEMPLLDGMLSIFAFVGEWIVEASSDLAVMFWDPTEGSLTFVGTLAVSALALAVSFLILSLIQRFLKFKG